jgi:hypothetical protein
MKILIVSPSDAYTNRMDLNHKDIMDNVRKNDKFSVVEVNDVWSGVANVDAHDLVISDDWPDLHKGYFKKNKILVGKFFEDYYPLEQAGREIGEDQYDFVLLRYNTPVTSSRRIFNVSRKYFLPHHFDLDVYQNWGLEKTFDVIIYGCMYEPLYPFRVRMRNLLMNNTHKYNIKYIEHSGYNNTTDCIRREELSKLINQSWMTLSVPMNHVRQYDDFLKKFGEGSLSYSLILGYVPEEAEMYYEGENYCRCTPEMTDAEILDTIDQELSDKKRMLEKIDKAYRVFREHFNVNDYSDKLYAICERVSYTT